MSLSLYCTGCVEDDRGRHECPYCGRTIAVRVQVRSNILSGVGRLADAAVDEANVW